MDNEAISEQGATAEIERYMAIPAKRWVIKLVRLKIQGSCARNMRMTL